MAVVARKAANALIIGAEPNWPAIKSGSTRAMIGKVQKRLGGLWVGGALKLDEISLRFTPNAMNQHLHVNDCSWVLELAKIDRVERRFGWFTGLIDIHAGEQIRIVRCYCAESFAAAIRAQIALARD